MSNPVVAIQKETNRSKGQHLRYPRQLGGTGDSRGHGQKFALFKFKEIQPGGSSIALDTVALLLPSALQDAYQVEYSDAPMGSIGAAVTGIGVGAGQMGDFSYDAVMNTLDNGMRTINSSLIGQVLSKKALSALPGISSADAGHVPGQIVTSATNRAINPYVTSVFKGIGFRTHNFTFRLTPEKDIDSTTIKKIISMFKESMLPEDIYSVGTTNPHSDMIKQGRDTGLQKLPFRFDIRFYPLVRDYQEPDEEFLFRIQDASMTSFTIDYSSEGGISFYKGTGAPQTATLNMTFIESRIYTRERHEAETKSWNSLAYNGERR